MTDEEKQVAYATAYYSFLMREATPDGKEPPEPNPADFGIDEILGELLARRVHMVRDAEIKKKRERK